MSTSYFILYGKISCARKLVVPKMFTAEALDTSWTSPLTQKAGIFCHFSSHAPTLLDIFLLSSKTMLNFITSVKPWKALSRCRPRLYLLTSLPGILDPMLRPLCQWTFVLTLQMSLTRTRIMLQSDYQIIQTWHGQYYHLFIATETQILVSLTPTPTLRYALEMPIKSTKDFCKPLNPFLCCDSFGFLQSGTIYVF